MRISRSMVKKLASVSVLGLGAIMFAQTAHAVDVPGTLNVTTSVNKSCTVNVGSLAFSSYDPTSTTDLSGTGTITITCTTGTSWTLTLGTGQNAAAATAAGLTTRAMKSGSNYLSYDLYTDSSHSGLWDAATSATASILDGSPETVTVYGKIPKEQAVADGTYADAVTINVNY